MCACGLWHSKEELGGQNQIKQRSNSAPEPESCQCDRKKSDNSIYYTNIHSLLRTFYTLNTG